MEVTEILRHGIVTEKATRLQNENNQYTFKVALQANKIEIRKAVEQMFKVHVVKVNTMRMPGKTRMLRRRGGRAPQVMEAREWKKAIVTLAPGDSIDILKA
ncbi:MAG TPA: 50S ribosomal protein L23 [Ktedonobacteraceae bacterium]|jgi:large subunit ribosomal protein L23|nr:50S ribosomal protein L23 [Ktedonobacteraceae bacterium]